MSTRKLIVAMPMNDEINLLKAHLTVYDGIVDYFVVSEAPWTHGLDPKPLHLKNALEAGVFSDEEKSRIIHVVLDPNPHASGYAHEYAHTWIAVDAPWKDARVPGREVLLNGKTPIWRIVNATSTSIYATDHINNKITDILPLMQSASTVAVKRWNWTGSDNQCLAEGVQRNALHEGIVKANLDLNDLIIIADSDEFVDPVLLKSLKDTSWTKNAPDEFVIPDGRRFVITHSSAWNPSLPENQSLKPIGPEQDGLPIPTCKQHLDSYYGVKLCLEWHIFTPYYKKVVEWGRRNESAILTTWNAYVHAVDHPNTFGRRMPCHFRRNNQEFPEIGPCGWHLSWMDPFKKLLAYAEWTKEQGKQAESWMKHCFDNKLDPTPIVFGRFSQRDDSHECFDRCNRTLVYVNDSFMPLLLKNL